MDKAHKCSRYETHTRMPVFDDNVGIWVMDLWKSDAEHVALQVFFCPFCGEKLEKPHED